MNKEEIKKYEKEYEDMSLCDFADEFVVPLFEVKDKDKLLKIIYINYAYERDEVYQLEEKIRISQEHPFLSKEAFEKLKKIKIEEDKEIEYIKGDYTLPVRPAKENEAFISGCLFAHEDKINELIKAVNELKNTKK